MSVRMSVRSCCLVFTLLIICPLSAVNGFVSVDELHQHFANHPNPTIDEILSLGFQGSSGRSLGGGDEEPDAYDMLLTPDQYQRLYNGKMERGAGRTVATMWTDGEIPYAFKEGDYSDSEKQLIVKGMETWNRLTCVRFRPKRTNDRNSIIIYRGNNDRCMAALGMAGGLQTVTLGAYCINKNTIEHEFGHTIGLIHEQQRNNRDGYVRVDYYAIKPQEVGWLIKYAQGSEQKMGLDYDYNSIMHYGPTAFTKSGNRTIYTRDPNKQYTIGGASGPSFLDVKLVNLMYNCQDRCRSPPRCSADCFVTKDCRCVCKEDMARESCENLNEQCEKWASEGECQNNPGYMLTHCRPACNTCPKTKESCENLSAHCEGWAKRGECQNNPGYMLTYCRLACDACLKTEVTPGSCRDSRADCRALAARGECKRNVKMMLSDCKKSCHFCPEDLGDDPTHKPGCVDYDMVCQYLADNGRCQKQRLSMSIECAEHCGTCNRNVRVPDNCVDTDFHCWIWAVCGYCGSSFMRDTCNYSCSTC